MELGRVKNVAKEYSMSPWTFYRWHCLGRFPKLFAKIGGVLFVDQTEFRRIAKESKENGDQNRSA